MAEFLEEATGLESTTIGIYRTAATVKGGRRFSFSAMVVVGDRNGQVALGYGKAPGVPAAIEKAQKAAKKDLVKLNLQEGTIPHEVTGRFCSSSVRLLPASPGTGVIAGSTVRAVLEMAGIRDCLTKAMGSTNQKNLAKAVLEGLKSLRSKQTIEQLRGVELGPTPVEQRIEAGRRFAPTSTADDKPKGPQAKQPEKKKGKGRGRQQKGGASQAKKPEQTAEQPQQQAEAQQPAPDQPQEQQPPAEPQQPESTGEQPSGEQQNSNQ